MKRLAIFLALSLPSGIVYSQTSNVTATITDPDGQTWNNGTFIATFVPSPDTLQPSKCNGNNFTQQFRGIMNGSGVFTVSVCDNGFVSPPGGTWQFTLCSNTSAPCQNVSQFVTGANPNLSSQLSSQLIAPRFGPGQFAFGYADLEVIASLLLPGSTYFNVGTGITRQWTGSAWANLGTGSGIVSSGSAAQQAIYLVNGTTVAGQTKPVIDVRDGYGGSGGVDCTRTNDSTTALNTMIANAPNFSSFLIPYGCQIKITSTITVLQKFGMRFDFQQEADEGTFSAAGLFWYGAQHGTMLYLNQVHGSIWQGLALNCSGTNTGFAPGTIGCDVAMLLDEPAVPNTITTNSSFFDLTIFNQAANPAFVGVDIGPNAPGNVENNYFWNAKVFCDGPASGDTDTAFRIGSAGTGSQPNNTQFSHGGPTNCGRGWWIRGNTAGVDIGDMTFGANFNSLYLAGGDNINYHDIVDQLTSQPINIAGSGAHLIIDNYNTSGTTVGPEINLGANNTSYMQLRSVKVTGGITTLAIGSAASLFLTETGPINTNDATFCTVIAANRQYDTYSQFCHLLPIGWIERANLVNGSANTDEIWPDSTAHRWKMNNNAAGGTSVAGLSDNLGAFATGGNISVGTITATGQIISSLSTGTAPFSIASTTPVGTLTVSNHPTLQDCGTTSTCANTKKTAALIVRGSVAFPTANTVTVTSLPFTGAANYSCTASDFTTAAGVINATTYTSGSSVTFTETNGVNTDTMRYVCMGF